MKKSIGDNMIPKGWSFADGLDSSRERDTTASNFGSEPFRGSR